MISLSTSADLCERTSASLSIFCSKHNAALNKTNKRMKDVTHTSVKEDIPHYFQPILMDSDSLKYGMEEDVTVSDLLAQLPIASARSNSN